MYSKKHLPQGVHFGKCQTSHIKPPSTAVRLGKTPGTQLIPRHLTVQVSTTPGGAGGGGGPKQLDITWSSCSGGGGRPGAPGCPGGPGGGPRQPEMMKSSSRLGTGPRSSWVRLWGGDPLVWNMSTPHVLMLRDPHCSGVGDPMDDVDVDSTWLVDMK